MTGMFSDATRLLRRHLQGTPHTGVDRVTLEYARWTHGSGGGLCLRKGAQLLRLIGTGWPKLLLRAAKATSGPTDVGRLGVLLGTLAVRRPLPRGSSILVSCHSWLWRGDTWRWCNRMDLRVFVFVHDLIPVQFPEYARPGEKERHRQRLNHTLRFSRGIIVNSRCTEGALLQHAAEAKLPVPPLLVAPLGHDPLVPEGTTLPKGLCRPYFVVLGTIEPRKNHLLLLNLWREMARTLPGASVPDLVVVGRRGWECEQVVDMLERCKAVRRHVHEIGTASDGQVATLLQNAQALLMPSFAEGFGIPVQEALSLGVPVISSPLPAIIEHAGDIPDYIQPYDGKAWLEAVLNYAAEDSTQRNMQLERMKGHKHPLWKNHFELLSAFLANV
jgi:glycosyltransferase involved in cell wall biosynthesis